MICATINVASNKLFWIVIQIISALGKIGPI